MNVFNESIDGIMQTYGYCCGRKHKFEPEKVYCLKKQCIIKENAKCYVYSKNDQFVFCTKCFLNLSEYVDVLNDM